MVGIALLRAAHPEPTAAVTVVAGLLALAVGHPVGSTLLVVATVAASQFTVGWANDAIDAPRDRRVGRTDKPIVAGRVSRRAVAIAAVTAGVATAALAALTLLAAAVAALVGLGSALAYNWPLKQTPVSVVPYAVSFACLPAFVVLALPQTPPWWLVTAGGLLGAGAHFANTLPDLAHDAATGIRGLPHRVGARGSILAAAALLLGALAVVVWGPPGPPAWWAAVLVMVAVVAVTAGGWAARRSVLAGARPTALFRTFLVVAVVTVGMLLVSPGR